MDYVACSGWCSHIGATGTKFFELDKLGIRWTEHFMENGKHYFYGYVVNNTKRQDNEVPLWKKITNYTVRFCFVMSI